MAYICLKPVVLINESGELLVIIFIWIDLAHINSSIETISVSLYVSQNEVREIYFLIIDLIEFLLPLFLFNLIFIFLFKTSYHFYFIFSFLFYSGNDNHLIIKKGMKIYIPKIIINFLYLFIKKIFITYLGLGKQLPNWYKNTFKMIAIKMKMIILRLFTNIHFISHHYILEKFYICYITEIVRKLNF